MSKFSICIPTHDRGENGQKWMRELLDSIKKQTFKDFDIVVTDQSKNDLILNVCKEYSDDFQFTYVRYEGNVPCENINFGLDECGGEIIKIIFSDDIFTSNLALEILNNFYEENQTKWAFSGFCEMTEDGKTTYDEKLPIWSEYTLEGCNLLSSPSVVSFRNDCKEYFDENLKLYLDVEFYHRMRWKNGIPHFIPQILVANRGHSSRISSTGYDAVFDHPEGKVNSWMINTKELNYIKEKHQKFYNNNRKYPDEK
jgi:glycosyltransferase involved in cell wall biosynthesis